jgi:phosphatidate cytidylyltransferase
VDFNFKKEGVFIMKQRIITAIILCLVAIPVCIFSGTIVFPIAMAFIGFMGVYEMLGCMGTRDNIFAAAPLYGLSIVVPFGVRYFGDFLRHNANVIVLVLLVYALYLLGIWVFSYEKNQKMDMNPILASSLIGLYIIGATSSIVMVRDSFGGEYYWYFIFIGAWITDTFAYFTGMLFGKHKLIPNVSPKKTVEGAIGGVVFCMIFFVGYGAIVNSLTPYNISLGLIALAGILSALVSMIGDLSMSVIKRTYGIKDYGKIFPGHGGVLDRFDSILAVAIVIALFLA